MKLLSIIALCLVTCCVGADSKSEATEAAPQDYVLQPSDLLKVIVFQEQDLEREVRISQESSVNLPLIGRVDLKGKTLRQAEELIRSSYDRDFLVNPQITVTVLEYTQRTVQVVGAVNQQGAVSFPPEQKMGLVEAIARAGGQTRVANLKLVRLTRTNADGRTENFIINVDDLVKGASGEQWLLQKGDVIFVPERII